MTPEQKAERYDKLRQALPLLARGDIEVHPDRASRWGVVTGLKKFPHDGTPESIEAAIIAAMESAQ